jgi:hypothetical protein
MATPSIVYVVSYQMREGSRGKWLECMAGYASQFDAKAAQVRAVTDPKHCRNVRFTALHVNAPESERTVIL